MTAKTRDGSLEAKIDGAIRGSEVHGAGEWRLVGDYPGKGEIQFTPLTFASLHEMAAQVQSIASCRLPERWRVTPRSAAR